MSQSRDWERARRRSAVRDADIRLRADGKTAVDPLEFLIRGVVTARKAGQFTRLPANLADRDRRRVLRLALNRIRTEEATRSL